MTRLTYVLCCLLMAMTVVTSCNTEDSYSTTLYSDAAITTFTLGTLTQYNSSGATVATLTGSNYKMFIDQVGTVDEKGNRTFTIANTDSLPIGTKVDSVVCSISSLNNGGIFIKNMGDDTFTAYSSSTGINLTQPRIVRVLSSDGQYVRDYTVKLNVKQSEDKKFAWKEKGGSALLEGCAKLHLVALGDQLLTFALKDNTLLVCRSTDEGANWTQLTTNLPQPIAANAWENVVVKDDRLFLLSNGQLLSSDNGEQWEPIASTGATELKQLFGVSTNELFALDKNSGIMASSDNGLSWRQEVMTTDKSCKLPTAGLSCTRFAVNDSTDYVLMAGNDGTHGIVWRKISHYKDAANSGKWVNIAFDSTNKTPLPLLDNLSLVCYDSKVLAFSNQLTVLQTPDQGITWTNDTTYKVTTEMHSVAADKKNNLWGVSTSGKVFQGAKF